MDKHLLHYESVIAVPEVLFVGHDPTLSGNVINLPTDESSYGYAVAYNGLEAWQWLTSKVESVDDFQAPFAVVFDAHWAIKDRFNLAQQMRNHPDLYAVPIVAISAIHNDKSIEYWLQNGIDDCYNTPISWERLETRLLFLNQYKPQFENWKKSAKLEAFKLKMPALKRLVDIICAIFLIILSSPLWVPVAIAIRLESKGPIFYRSKRVGAGYHFFDFFKFRSMSIHADKLLDEYRFMNQYADGTVFVKIPNDPRVTKVGRFIRKYSIDELPQLVNVLRGEMSLIGNRPLPVYEAETLVNEACCARFLAPAGMTGLWQVTKRGQSNMSQEERIALDIRYYRTHSFLNDLKILIKTPFAVVQKENV